jgi:hypothetical protein
MAKYGQNFHSFDWPRSEERLKEARKAGQMGEKQWNLMGPN